MPSSDERMPNGKLILLVDFDGCIHSYKSGWKGVDVIPDPPVPGVFEWLEATIIYFDVQIYSARSIEALGRAAMYNYITKHAGPNSTLAGRLRYPSQKPRAFLTIDDRCLQFNGNWSEPQFDPRTLLRFKSWYQKT